MGYGFNYSNSTANDARNNITNQPIFNRDKSMVWYIHGYLMDK